MKQEITDILDILTGLHIHETEAWAECADIFSQVPDENKAQYFVDVMTALTARGIPVNTSFIQGMDGLTADPVEVEGVQ